ncbi:hypothetical protein ACROYT_G026041 [Oculina patagonica]
MRFLEIKDLAVTPKVHLVLLLIAVSSCCCTGRPQTIKCLIQSYFRKMHGSGQAGNGNLLRVHLQLNAPFAPTRLSFTGSCNDSAQYTEFQMLKTTENGSLLVSFQWNHKHSYMVVLRNKTLVIEHINNLSHDDEFVFECATTSTTDCTFTTLKSFKSVSSGPTKEDTYIRTDSTGQPLVGFNSADVTAWFNILKTSKKCPLNRKQPTTCN